MTSSSNTATVIFADESSAVVEPVRRPPAPAQQNVANAVYTYIQAIRALGRTRVNTIEIAEALSLPTSAVDRAIVELEKQGVKLANV